MKRLMVFIVSSLFVIAAMGAGFNTGGFRVSAPSGAVFPLNTPLTALASISFGAESGSFLQNILATSPSSGKITFSSQNTESAVVDALGNVTPAGVGTTCIVINQAPVGGYWTAAQISVPVTVGVIAPWNYASACISFDGVDDYARTLAYSPATNPYNWAPGWDDKSLPWGTAPRTIMAWVYDDTVATSTQAIIGYGNGDTRGGNIIIFFSGTGMYVSNAWTGAFMGSDTVRTSGWNHWAVTRTELGRAKDTLIYKNGEQIGTYTNAEVASTDISNMNVNFGGKIKMAEVAFYNYAMTRQEVQSKYLYKIPNNDLGLIRVYHCDEGSGQELFDLKSGKTMTISGATWSTK